jgi:hypothetical protein
MDGQTAVVTGTSRAVTGSLVDAGDTVAERLGGSGGHDPGDVATQLRFPRPDVPAGELDGRDWQSATE